MKPDVRVGLGTDLHRLVSGRTLVLGGVRIDHDRGPDAHSDGDVLLHATVDALLGAAALGDIGELFPDTDPTYKGMNSEVFVRKALDLVREHGWELVNLDAVVTAQAPKLKPYKLPIRQRMSEVTGLPVDRISVKAKTAEKLGPLGEEKAIAAEVVVLIQRTEPE
jgi:2-C-methyl-D-erythritol 2,4-cyclodiphosphate synthase